MFCPTCNGRAASSIPSESFPLSLAGRGTPSPHWFALLWKQQKWDTAGINTLALAVNQGLSFLLLVKELLVTSDVTKDITESCCISEIGGIGVLRSLSRCLKPECCSFVIFYLFKNKQTNKKLHWAISQAEENCTICMYDKNMQSVVACVVSMGMGLARHCHASPKMSSPLAASKESREWGNRECPIILRRIPYRAGLWHICKATLWITSKVFCFCLLSAWDADIPMKPCLLAAFTFLQHCRSTQVAVINEMSQFLSTSQLNWNFIPWRNPPPSSLSICLRLKVLCSISPKFFSQEFSCCSPFWPLLQIPWQPPAPLIKLFLSSQQWATPLLQLYNRPFYSQK